jgi:hypothetical protein
LADRNPSAKWQACLRIASYHGGAGSEGRLSALLFLRGQLPNQWVLTMAQSAKTGHAMPFVATAPSFLPFVETWRSDDE